MSKRLRIFGGPNGSGKTTLYRVTKDKFHTSFQTHLCLLVQEEQSY